MDNRRRRFAEMLLGSEHDPSFRSDILSSIERGTHELKPPRQPWPVKERRLREGEEAIPTVCQSCHTTCEVIAYRDKKSGKVLRVEGDIDSPQTRGFCCSKGLAAVDHLYNPKRIMKPLRRVGERGEGKFEEISWEEALDITASKLKEYKERYGPQGVAILEGTKRGWSREYSRFANVFGSPNNGASGWAQCFLPRTIDCNVTFGPGALYSETQDYPNTHCIVCWGCNPPTSWGVRANDIMEVRQRGAALIVVDPFLSEIAAKADIWLQIKPDTDMALALGLIHIIINEELYDKEFVEKWTTGFETIRDSISEYTPEWTSRITGVDSELIIKAARIYAKASPACVVRSLALDQVHDSIQVCRAISILISLTGNIGNPGGNIVGSKRGERSQNSLEFIKNSAIPEEIVKLRCGYEEYPLLTRPPSTIPTAHMPTLWRQVISGEPYPIKAALIFGSNAIVSYTNSDEVEKALSKLEFIAVSDLYLTPTAKYADIVLPVSSWLERHNILSNFQTDNTHTLFQQPATHIEGSKSDIDLIIELAKRLGFADQFWDSPVALYDYLLEPTGITYWEGVAKRRLYSPLEYRGFEKSGFKTPSGKIELYSSIMEKMGVSPIPRYTPSFQSPTDTPELAEKYPLIITTGRHENAFRISENRLNPHLLELVPKPFLDINPDTAAELGIADGQKVLIESTAGKAYAYARYTLGLHPSVVQGISGWWGEYNINKTVPWGAYSEGIGSVCARGYLCKVSPVAEI
jgi:anaerobic selenocysteine-containing dehydrogenase